MPTNFYMYFIVGLIPLLVGFVYYHEKVLGGPWMKVNGFTKESLQGGNMAVTFILSYIFAVFIGYILTTVIIHQGGIYSTMFPDIMESGSEAQNTFNSLMATYGERHRNFGHGALHAGILAVFLVFPIIATLALFEKRGWKYIFINWFYWAICLIIMGGVLCQTLKFPDLI